MQSFKLKFSGVTILQGVKFPIFLLIFEWALQQCSATALPVINDVYRDQQENRHRYLLMVIVDNSLNLRRFCMDYSKTGFKRETHGNQIGVL